MIRIFAALSLLLAGTASLVAQEAAPSTTPPSQIVIDPLAPIDSTPKNANLLTGLYATRAVIELCGLTIDPAVMTRMSNDQRRFEVGMAMDAATSEKAYAGVKANVEKTTPDCAEGSADRQGVEAVVSIYANPGAAAAAPASAPAAQ